MISRGFTSLCWNLKELQNYNINQNKLLTGVYLLANMIDYIHLLLMFLHNQYSISLIIYTFTHIGIILQFVYTIFYPNILSAVLFYVFN